MHVQAKFRCEVHFLLQVLSADKSRGVSPSNWLHFQLIDTKKKNWRHKRCFKYAKLLICLNFFIEALRHTILFHLQYCLITPHTKSQTIAIISVPASFLQGSQRLSHSTLYPHQLCCVDLASHCVVLDLCWLLYCIYLIPTREIILNPSISV